MTSSLRDYKRERVLGSGGFGTAVLVTSKKNRRRYVIKEIEAKLSGRALQVGQTRQDC